MPHRQTRLLRDAQGRAREVAWDVDLDVLAAAQYWARDRDRMARELDAMARMYPAWCLTAGVLHRPLERRGKPSDLAVPTQGGWFWASDGARAEVPQNATLLWVGLLPAPLAGLPKVVQKAGGKYPIEQIGGAPWMAVPVRVMYSPGFPNAEPLVYYDQAWTHALGINYGGSVHLLHEALLCIFYPGHWKRRYTVADVLSQRVVNHLYSTLKIANGMSAHEAFIGRVHNNEWKPRAS
ncbi:MAG: hypothetical protein M5U26_06660 [Planctomycetota bacterium]|nr:hypothetical protein [Planctomycetota bacterium]